MAAFRTLTPQKDPRNWTACAPSRCPAVTGQFHVALQEVPFCLKLVFYCQFMLSVLMSSSTSQQNNHEGWSQANWQLSSQWKGPSINSSIYEQLCCAADQTRTREMQQQVSSFLFYSSSQVKFKSRAVQMMQLLLCMVYIVQKMPTKKNFEPNSHTNV